MEGERKEEKIRWRKGWMEARRRKRDGRRDGRREDKVEEGKDGCWKKREKGMEAH